VIVLDASLLIAHLDASDAQHERAVEQLLAMAGETFVCSPITRAEVLVGPARTDRLDVAATALATLGLDDVALGSDAPARLAALRARTNLKLPDCCVLLAAEDSAATQIATFDDRLAREAAKLGFG
jgi:toxin FitB